MKINYTRITPPSKLESIKLRLMIVIGIGCLFLFLRTVFIPDHGGYRLLYIPLCITLVYMCLKYLHEWYHYFNITAPQVITEIQTFSVDVFTTYCKGEPLDMLETTLEAMSLIRYPHTSWCCDEADDPSVKSICDEYGIRHITRKEKKDAKAGNINNALQYATGEICVILDPDHVPAPEFLDVVLPYFKNEKLAFVQVVQAYYNHHESLVAKGAAQQTYQFYGPMMMCMHTYGTVQALGANCTFRRSALDSIGGHATGLAEDMHTAMKLHAKGWESIYVPAVITRGLVPATLSAYYKQQLKWSRGTSELLVSTYPKLFWKFTIFQKIHYCMLPLHYLSGFIFLLNFLIPVFSLFLGESPLLLDFSDFILASLPLAFSIILIRQYVQKWVVEENERGFHMVGGLLQIGTWWVHLTGLIYTLIRKKVPYIPTPKNDVDVTPFKLHLPNLIIVLLSIVAIVYGLNYDWTPFSLFMSVLAFVNICILLFVVYASSYKRKRQFSKTWSLMKTKRSLWYFRHWTYKIARNYALVFFTMVIATSIYVHFIYSSERVFSLEKIPMQTTFYKGVFQPGAENGISPASDFLSRSSADIQIVSHYIAWTDSSKKIGLPLLDINKLYERNIFPLITLEPWLNGKQIFDQIISGVYDSAISSMAKQFAQLDKPVFLRFAHEPENPRYPWSFQNGNKPQTFVAAWKYLHKKFDEANAKKIIWVWNPWKADSMQQFFPGQSYVDWIGVNILDYAGENQSTSFEDLYQPFHNDSIFKLGLPVMLTETGTLSIEKQEWWGNAWSIMQKKFREIRAAIMFNSSFDHYNVNGYQVATLPWKWNFDSAFQSAPLSTQFYQTSSENLLHPVVASASSLPQDMRAVGYDKGVHWFRNLHTLTTKTLQSDVKQMKKLGVNTILRTLPDIYHRNFFKVVNEEKLNVIPRLWADLPLSKLMNDDYLAGEKERLLQVVKDFKKEKSVIAWNLSNDVLYSIETGVSKPDRVVYQRKYILWLQQLIQDIRRADAVHPIVASVVWNDHADERIRLYESFVGNASLFFLDAEKEEAQLPSLHLSPKFSWVIADPSLWNSPANNLVIPSWQDQQTTGFATLNGILDIKGRKKQAFDEVDKKWNNRISDISVYHAVKILRPTKLPYEGKTLLYHALVKNGFGEWVFASDSKKQIRFEWYLVHTDPYGNELSVKPVGKGESLALKIPSLPEFYYLYLEAILNNEVVTVRSPLGLPLDIEKVK